MSPKKTHTRRFVRHLYLLCFSALICACQTTPPPLNIDPDLRYRKLSKLKHWAAKGKLSLSHNQGRNSASYTWQQIDDHFKIHLFGPLGQGSTWLKSDDNGVSIEGADIELKTAANPELLMEQTLGWQLPVSNLRYWITGLPSPETPVTYSPETPESSIPGFIQDGWVIEYSKAKVHNDIAMPEKAIFTHDNLRLLVIIKGWEI